MPALKSQVISPVPAPTEPSATGPLGGLLDGAVDVLRADVAPDGVVEPRVVALADERDDHVLLAADAWATSCVIHLTAASETLPTDIVLVSRIGVSSSPHSCTWVSPETSPAPLSTKPPATHAVLEDVGVRA